MQWNEMAITVYSACLLTLATLTTAAGIPAHHAPSLFTSHVTVHTPGHSYSHGVGDAVAAQPPPPAAPTRRHYPSLQLHGNLRNVRVFPYVAIRNPYGYRKEIPIVPFYQEEIPLGNSLAQSPWHADNFFKGGTIPVLPASPYRVNSPNPESLWPEGLFIPPSVPLRGFGLNVRLAAKSDNFVHTSDNEVDDPYLLSDEEALQALDDIKRHGELFFHDIPHRRSLLENQQLRIDNGLEPHRLGSIRNSWLHYRP